MSTDDYLARFQLIANQKAFISPYNNPAQAEALCEEWNNLVSAAVGDGVSHKLIRDVWCSVSFLNSREHPNDIFVQEDGGVLEGKSKEEGFGV